MADRPSGSGKFYKPPRTNLAGELPPPAPRYRGQAPRYRGQAPRHRGQAPRSQAPRAPRAQAPRAQAPRGEAPWGQAPSLTPPLRMEREPRPMHLLPYIPKPPIPPNVDHSLLALQISAKLLSYHSVAVLGPPSVGRSSLLRLLGNVQLDHDNNESVSFDKLTFLAQPRSGQILDIPYLKGIIYMIDPFQMESITTVLEKLSRVRNVIVAILCNKKDLCSDIQASYIISDFKIPSCVMKKFTFYMCSVNGSDGIAEALDWLGRRFVENEEAASVAPARLPIEPPISGFPLAQALFPIDLVSRHSVAVLGTKSAGRSTLLSLLGLIKFEGDTECVHVHNVTFYAPNSMERYDLATRKPQIDGILYVIDVSSEDSLKQAKEDLHRIFFCIEMKKVFVTILANKSDLKGPIDTLKEVTESLSIPPFFKERYVLSMCSLLSDVGIQSIFGTLTWLCRNFIDKPIPLPFEALRMSPPLVQKVPMGVIQWERRYNIHEYPHANFLGVDLFQGHALITDESVILSLDDYGEVAIMKNCAPGGIIEWGHGQKLSNSDHVPRCLKFYGNFRDWPPANSSILCHMLWGPSHGRDKRNKDGSLVLRIPPLDKNISQLHNLILGVLSGDGYAFEVNEEREFEKDTLFREIEALANNDSDLKQKIRDRGAVYEDVYRFLCYEYRKHGRRGYFTVENFVRLMILINETYSLESLLSKFNRLPIAGKCVKVNLSDLHRELEAAAGAKLRLDLANNLGKYYLIGVEFMFYINGEQLHHPGSSVRGLLAESKEKDVKVYIESIEYRRKKAGLTLPRREKAPLLC